MTADILSHPPSLHLFSFRIMGPHSEHRFSISLFYLGCQRISSPLFREIIIFCSALQPRDQWLDNRGSSLFSCFPELSLLLSFKFFFLKYVLKSQWITFSFASASQLLTSMTLIHRVLILGWSGHTDGAIMPSCNDCEPLFTITYPSSLYGVRALVSLISICLQRFQTREDQKEAWKLQRRPD